jgi:hypothetical protein
MNRFIVIKVSVPEDYLDVSDELVFADFMDSKSYFQCDLINTTDLVNTSKKLFKELKEPDMPNLGDSKLNTDSFVKIINEVEKQHVNLLGRLSLLESVHKNGIYSRRKRLADLTDENNRLKVQCDAQVIELKAVLADYNKYKEALGQIGHECLHSDTFCFTREQMQNIARNALKDEK